MKIVENLLHILLVLRVEFFFKEYLDFVCTADIGCIKIPDRAEIRPNIPGFMFLATFCYCYFVGPYDGELSRICPNATPFVHSF